MSSDVDSWAPCCGSARLRARAQLLARIRAYFAEQGVLEVETPVLARHTVTDPHLAPFLTSIALPGSSAASELYLQTSPEFAMKRLLAAGSGSIYQICKAFRNGEIGRWHNPEFTLLEWYRVGFDLDHLIDDVTALLTRLAAGHRCLEPAQRLSYTEAFARHVGVDPIAADLGEFERRARSLGFAEAGDICGSDRANWLDFLFSHAVQADLGCDRLCFIVDYPACLPSLARPHPDNPALVQRVEVFLDGIELGNGFHELADAAEQERRFDHDIAGLTRLGHAPRRKDQHLLEALRSGLPDCSGIAIGLDRILALLTGAASLETVLAFPIGNA